MRIPFADQNEAHTGQRVCVGNTRELRRARALGPVPVLASGWEGSSWLAELTPRPAASVTWSRGRNTAASAAEGG